MTSLDALQQGVVTQRAGIRFTERAMAKATEDAIEGLGLTSTLFARDIINQAVLKIQNEFTEDLTVFAQAMADKSARNRDGRVTRIHQLAGERAVEATVRSYNRTRAKRRKASRLVQNTGGGGLVGAGRANEVGNVGSAETRSRFQERLDPSIERKDRFANGKMSRALASPQMFDARWDGVSFINKPWLDRNAAQWYRLSFGAGTRGQTTPPHRNYNVNFFGASAFSMSLQSFGPSAGFSMPAGIWFGFDQSTSGTTSPGDSANQKRPGQPNPARRGLDQFVPGSFGGKAFAGRRTAGIQGTAYLDAGVAALTRELGRGWSVLMTEWFEEAATQDTGPIASVGVSPETAAVAAARLKDKLGDMNLEVTRYKSSLNL